MRPAAAGNGGIDLPSPFRDPIDVLAPASTDPPSGRFALIWASVIVAILSTWLAHASKGFLEADGVTHYLYARYAFETPGYMVDVWARPMRMVLHAVPAHFFGLSGVRAASLVAAIGTAWLTYAIACRLKWRMPGLAGVFVLVQPLFFLHSFSELTEIPFALLAAAAILALLYRQWWAFALLCGLTPGARPEGAAFIAMAIVLLTLHRRWFEIPLVVVPLVLWNHLGWWLWGANAGPWHRWLIDHFPYSAQSAYPPGPIYRYLAVLPTVVSPLLIPALLIGTFGLRRWRGATRDEGTPLGRLIVPDEWLISIIPWGILLVHSLLHFFGKMSSSGEPRYILATSPFWALLACRGWTMMSERFHWRRPILIAAIAVSVPVVVNLAYKVVPLREQPDALLCREIRDWYMSAPWHDAYPHLYATHPLVYYYCDLPIQGGGKAIVEHPPAGAVFVYDSLYGVWNSDTGRKMSPEMFEANGWKLAPGSERFGLPGQTWRIYLSPQATPSPGMPGEGRGEGS